MAKQDAARKKTGLKDSQLSEIRDSFDLFDQDGLGAIRATDLAVMLRALGAEPHKNEIKRFLAEVDGANTGQLDFDNYLQIILDKQAEKPTADEVAKAFRLFSEADNEHGRISFERLKQISETIGEQISDEELREMIAEADTSGSGLIGNDDFARIVTTRHRAA